MRQFLNGRRIGLIGTSEEKDEAMAQEQAHLEAGRHGGVEEIEGVPPQISATLGMPEPTAVARRQVRVRENLHLLPKNAQEAILTSFEQNGGQNAHDCDAATGHHHNDDADTASIPTRSR